MNKRAEDKIQEIERFLQELETIIPDNYDTYVADYKTKAACERYIEKMIEALVDLSFLIIKERNFRMPESDKKAFLILEEEKVISYQLSEKLQNAKGMRNVLAHEYGTVDDKIIFEALTVELVVDIQEFLKQVQK